MLAMVNRHVIWSRPVLGLKQWVNWWVVVTCVPVLSAPEDARGHPFRPFSVNLLSSRGQSNPNKRCKGSAGLASVLASC